MFYTATKGRLAGMLLTRISVAKPNHFQKHELWLMETGSGQPVPAVVVFLFLRRPPRGPESFLSGQTRVVEKIDYRVRRV